MNELQALISPRSIAILGASADLNKVNGRTLRFLQEKGYAGRIFPVNPKYESIAGLRCYPAIAALPEVPDLAVILDGAHGKPPVNKTALAQMISAVSRFGAAAGPRLAELDLNPVLAGPQGVTAVDWLMVLD